MQLYDYDNTLFTLEEVSAITGIADLVKLETILAKGIPVYQLIPNTPKVLNKYKSGIPKNAVYIGRPSKWGNPFTIGKDGTRAEVISKYRSWVSQQPNLIASIKHELKGKDLVCFCAPQPCHGDILLKIANEY